MKFAMKSTRTGRIGSIRGLLKKGTGSEPTAVITAKNGRREVTVTKFGQHEQLDRPVYLSLPDLVTVTFIRFYSFRCSVFIRGLAWRELPTCVWIFGLVAVVAHDGE